MRVSRPSVLMWKNECSHQLLCVTDLTTWYMEQLQAASDTLSASGVRLRVSLHVTSSASPSQLSGFSVSAARPDTAAHVQGAVRRASKESLASLAVVVCGPRGMADDVAKASSTAQWDILKRSTGVLREVYLVSLRGCEPTRDRADTHCLPRRSTNRSRGKMHIDKRLSKRLRGLIIIASHLIHLVKCHRLELTGRACGVRSRGRREVGWPHRAEKRLCRK